MATGKGRVPQAKPTKPRSRASRGEVDDGDDLRAAVSALAAAKAAKGEFAVTRGGAAAADDGDEYDEEDEEDDSDDFDEDPDGDDEDEGGDEPLPEPRGLTPRKGPRTSAADRLAAHAGAAFMDPNEPFDVSGDVRHLNNPDVERLSEVPALGRARNNLPDMFQNASQPLGQPSTPRLWEEASRFPTATQFRVWMIDNGNPVSIGSIDVNASEEDFLRHFYDAMPKPGEAKKAFRFRPIDINSHELGEQFTKIISEHHTTLRQIREAKKHEEQGRDMFAGLGAPREPNGGVVVNTQGDGGASSQLVEEMSRLMEDTISLSEERASQLQQSLDEERRRLREEDKQRADERVTMAERQIGTVEKMTERLMQSDRARADEVVKAQRDQGALLLSTMTTVFQQQQTAAREQSERLRQDDERRLQQEREYFSRKQKEEEDRRRADAEVELARRDREKAEMEARRLQDREEGERRRKEEEARAAERLAIAEKQANMQMEMMKGSLERERTDMQLRADREREESRARAEREAAMLGLERERMKAEAESTRLRLEAERLAAREEAERRDRREEDRMRREREEAKEREERRLDALRREEENRREASKREDDARRDAAARDEARRTQELTLQMKQMEVTAQRDREHAERMLEMARQEREAQRESALQREKADAVGRELQEAERQRQHAMAMKEIELNRERDREHAERMLQLSKAQQTGGLGSLTDMLGMDTGELLERIFNQDKGDAGGGWGETLSKGLGAVFDIAKTAASMPRPPAGLPPPPPGFAVPQQDPRFLPSAPAQPAARTAQAQAQAQANQAAQAQAQAAQAAMQEAAGSPDDGAPDVAEVVVTPYEVGAQVNTRRRAKDANLSSVDVSKCRKGLAALGEKISKAPEESWEELVGVAIMENPKLFTYIEAVTVYAALAEAKLDEALVNKIVARLRMSSIVPASLPFTEEDYEKLHGGEA